jgi:hypothetical protein
MRGDKWYDLEALFRWDFLVGVCMGTQELKRQLPILGPGTQPFRGQGLTVEFATNR